MTSSKNASALQRYVVEMIGVFFLVFAGVMAIKGVVAFASGAGIVGIALAHGLALGCAIAAGGHISGGHYNPAVTVSLASVGKLSWNHVPGYIIAQLVGAFVAVLVATQVSGGAGGLGECQVGSGFTTTQALLAEIVLTFFLVYVVSAVGTDSTAAGTYVTPFAIGLTVTFDILAGGPVSGAAMNPARWFGPAAYGGDFTNAWVYLVGPLVGGLIGAWAYRFVRANK